MTTETQTEMVQVSAEALTQGTNTLRNCYIKINYAIQSLVMYC